MSKISKEKVAKIVHSLKELAWNCQYFFPPFYLMAHKIRHYVYRIASPLCTKNKVKIGLTDVGVTQMPHPLLNSQPPFYQLHPCHTANWMGTMLKNVSKESNYLVTWLSFVAPYVGLQLSEKYAIKWKCLIRVQWAIKDEKRCSWGKPHTYYLLLYFCIFSPHCVLLEKNGHIF